MQSIYKIPTVDCAAGSTPEKLIKIIEAADAIGAYRWQVRRAVQRGDIPHYTPFNSRKLVKLSEVVAYIESCRQGGVV